MKKLLTIGTALLVLSGSAMATEARLLALGMNETDNEGMYYIQDGRNIFLNSAYVNLYPDQVVAEWGAAGLVPGGNTLQTVDQNHRPKAQGGVFKKYGAMTYGVYYGNESNTSSLLRIVATQPGAGLLNPLPTADNQIDVFVGGDAGIKWGANVTYAHSMTESTTPETKQTGIATRLGVLGDSWDAHANVSLKSDAESPFSTGTQKFDGKIGFQVGGSFAFMPQTRVFGYVKHYGWDQLAQGLSTVEGDFTSYYLGLGHEMDVNTGGKVFMALTAKKTDINLKYAQKGEIRHIVVPVNIGYEQAATDWLTLRGSIVQNIWGQRDNKRVSAGATDLNTIASTLIPAIYGGSGKATIANSTEVNAGATLTFGALSIDGLLGLTGSSRIGSTGVATPNRNQGVLAFDNLLSRVGMTYKF